MVDVSKYYKIDLIVDQDYRHRQYILRAMSAKSAGLTVAIALYSLSIGQCSGNSYSTLFTLAHASLYSAMYGLGCELGASLGGCSLDVSDNSYALSGFDNVAYPAIAVSASQQCPYTERPVLYTGYHNGKAYNYAHRPMTQARINETFANYREIMINATTRACYLYSPCNQSFTGVNDMTGNATLFVSSRAAAVVSSLNASKYYCNLVEEEYGIGVMPLFRSVLDYSGYQGSPGGGVGISEVGFLHDWQYYLNYTRYAP